VEHIHATPGWQDSSWPREMTPDENRADLQRHADDFRNRKGFTYTVLDPASREVIGCVYIYPVPDSDYGAHGSPGYGRATRSWTPRSGAPSVSGSRPTGRSAASSTPRAPRRPQAAVQLDSGRGTFRSAGPAGEHRA
jgi:hypothetical protein